MAPSGSSATLDVRNSQIDTTSGTGPVNGVVTTAGGVALANDVVTMSAGDSGGTARGLDLGGGTHGSVTQTSVDYSYTGAGSTPSADLQGIRVSGSSPVVLRDDSVALHHVGTGQGLVIENTNLPTAQGLDIQIDADFAGNAAGINVNGGSATCKGASVRTTAASRVRPRPRGQWRHSSIGQLRRHR